MILDGRRIDEAQNVSYDVVIVGSGPAGLTIAHELKDSGLRIAVLESGGEDHDDTAQSLNEGRIEGNDDEYDLASSRLRYLGGTSNHWGGHCTILDLIDFERSWPGYSGWPFRRATLDPFYERAHTYCDLGAYRYDVSDLAPSDPDLKLLPEVSDLETAVLRQSPPTRFGEKYRDALQESEMVHIWLWTTATGISTVPGGMQEWVDTVALGGPSRRFTARAVILAAGAIESTRLMLWANATNGTRAGDAAGLLGRCYMDHPSGGAAFLHFDQPQSNLLYWSDIDTYADDGVPLHFVWRLTDAALAERGLPNFHYFVIPFADEGAAQERRTAAQRSISSLKRLARWTLGHDTGGRPVNPGDEYCGFFTNADDYVADTAIRLVQGDGYRRALLKFEAEERPNRDNGLRLDPTAKDATGVPRPVLRWSTSRDDILAIQETATLFGRFAGAEGLGRLELEDHDADPHWNITTAWHQLGTMRMAESPTSGVVDTDCRVHGAGALYVASGAVFPQVGRANPTLTIVALAIRLSDHLKARLT